MNTLRIIRDTIIFKQEREVHEKYHKVLTVLQTTFTASDKIDFTVRKWINHDITA
jgi:hypothetical protein